MCIYLCMSMCEEGCVLLLVVLLVAHPSFKKDQGILPQEQPPVIQE